MNDTANKILDIAKEYIQSVGLNCFSYKDIASRMGIKTSSIHYYFPSKQNLVLNLLQRCIMDYQTLLQEIDGSKISYIEKLYCFSDIFIASIEDNKFCIFGMLLAEVKLLPNEILDELKKFTLITHIWIKRIADEGIINNEIKDSLQTNTFAMSYLAILEGSSLIARMEEKEYFVIIVQNFINEIIK